MADKQGKGKFQMLFSKILVIGGLAAIVVCAYGFICDYYVFEQSREYYADISVTTIDMPLVPKSEYADAKSAYMPYEDFKALCETNSSIVAWVYCEGTIINYPVVQGDDNEYYLNRLPDGTKNKTGSIFLDYRNSPEFTDKNSVIYGHHMKSGEMFSALENYKDQSFYDENPTIMLYTSEGKSVVELLAGYVVDASRETVPRSFANSDDFEQYITKIQKRSTFVCDIEVSVSDRLLSLCTCTYDFSNARFILVGKLAGNGEVL